MIPVQNIYYMLAYAFRFLREQGFSDLEAEPFENTADLLSAILVRGVELQLKRGLIRDYVPHSEAVSAPRGKIQVTESIRRRTLHRGQLVCAYEEFSLDTGYHQILKTAMETLLRFDIPQKRKKKLRRLLAYFGAVNSVPPRDLPWKLGYRRNNRSYRMLISICYLVLHGLLQTQRDGSLRMLEFLDEQNMCRLYEKFILEYYRREYPALHPSPMQIKWALDDDNSALLPTMQTDITLTHGERRLILDAKYYSHSTQSHFGKHTIHSQNLYQIFTYVKNEAQRCPDVSGLLLYAKTEEEVQPEADYRMSGNSIGVRTLDLSGDFSNIKARLNGIADGWMACPAVHHN